MLAPELLQIAPSLNPVTESEQLSAVVRGSNAPAYYRYHFGERSPDVLLGHFGPRIKDELVFKSLILANEALELEDKIDSWLLENGVKAVNWYCQGISKVVQMLYF
jgi:hypothetical protein